MKVDRRKQRTQKLLRQSLIALILEKGYDAITVQDITDHANLGRATFYLHYHDKDELLASLMEELLNDQVEQVMLLPKAEINGSQKPGKMVFEHAQQNADLYRAILGGGGLAGVLSNYRRLSADHVEAQLREFVSSGTDIPMDLVAHYIVGALNASVVWWLENDRPYPAEYMANIFHRLTTLGVTQTLIGNTATEHDPENS